MWNQERKHLRAKERGGEACQGVLGIATGLFEARERVSISGFGEEKRGQKGVGWQKPAISQRNTP